MADKNLDGNGLSEVWVRAAQLVKKYTGAVDSAKGDLQTQVNEKLSGTDDTKDNTVTFTSADELNPTAWKDVNVLSSKEKHLSLLNKISTMFSNVRYLYNILGTTDISALGTVTQAIATLNGNVGSIKGISSSAAITTQGQYALDAREKNASINGTLANELSKVNSNLDNVNRNFTYYDNPIYRGTIDIWTDESQIMDRAGLYGISAISDDLWSKINKTTLNNVGDYTLFIFRPNGNGSLRFGTGFLVSPRWGTAFCYVHCWEGVFTLARVQFMNAESSEAN